MYSAQECSAKADHYAQLARDAPSMVERDRLQRMQRSYSLMVRNAQFIASLEKTVTRT
jgi:hypothetical protein